MINERLILTQEQRAVLPAEAQKLYVDVYQTTWEQYDARRDGPMGRDAVASISAMAAVTRQFEREEGSLQWHRRCEQPSFVKEVPQERAARPAVTPVPQLLDSLRRLFRRHQPDATHAGSAR
jgi:cation transport regulator ChaB